MDQLQFYTRMRPKCLFVERHEIKMRDKMIQCGQWLKNPVNMRSFFGNARGLRYTKDQFNLA